MKREVGNIKKIIIAKLQVKLKSERKFTEFFMRFIKPESIHYQKTYTTKKCIAGKML